MDFETMEQKNEKFALASNRIAYYYEKVFNVEIITLFYKRNKNKSSKKLVSNDNFLDKIKEEEFDFYILVKDYNKKIFRYRMIKAHYDNKKYKDEQNIDFLDKIYFFVDEYLCKYCRKYYTNSKHNKIHNEELNDIIYKNNELNSEYQKWIIEHYEN